MTTATLTNTRVRTEELRRLHFVWQASSSSGEMAVRIEPGLISDDDYLDVRHTPISDDPDVVSIFPWLDPMTSLADITFRVGQLAIEMADELYPGELQDYLVAFRRLLILFNLDA